MTRLVRCANCGHPFEAGEPECPACTALPPVQWCPVLTGAGMVWALILAAIAWLVG